VEWRRIRTAFASIFVCLLFGMLAVEFVSGAGVAYASPTTYRDEVLADNPVSYWRFNEASGTTAADERGLNNGTYAGGVSLGQGGAIVSDPANNAVSFDGIDDSMSVASPTSLSMSSAVSVELWVKRSRSGVFQAIAGKPTSGQSRFENYSIWFNATNQIRMYIGDGVNYAQATSATAFDTNWHYVVGTFDNSTIRVYVDGVQSGSSSTTIRLTPNANPFYVGRSSTSTTLNYGGLLDELAVYSTVLSAARIQAHYNKAFADLVPPVVTLTQPANGSFKTSSTVSFSGLAGNAPGDSATVSVKIYAGGTPTGTPSQTLTATRQPNNSYSASTTIADGQWTAQAEQSDASSNTGQSSANTFMVDTVAPITTIASSPVSPTNDTTATFGFFGSEPASFACRLDGGSFGSCTSPQGYSGLVEGSHTFDVRATDTAGNTGPTASFSWTIDTTAPPTPTITSGPPNPSGSTTASFSFTDGEPSAALLCQLDGGGFSPCTSPQVYDSLAFETHTFEVKAADLAGNESSVASYTWTVDLGGQPPPTITSGPPDPSGSAVATFDFTDDDAGASFECRLDGAAFAPCTSPKGYTGLADGSHTFSVRAIGASGTSEATSYPWTIITTPPPAPTITSSPPDPSSSTSASFGFTGTPGVTFRCELDGGGFSACTNPKSYSALAESSHTFRVKARDAAGNESVAASYTWTVDITAPVAPTITAHPPDPSSSADASFGFEAGQQVNFECRLDGGGFSACTSPHGYFALADGSHTFRVRAIDAAGNTGPETTYTWTINTVAPPAPTITSSPPNPSGSTSASFAFTGSPAGVSFLCRLDAGGFTACTSPKSYSGLAEGSHTFQVKARDAAGNESVPTSYTWVIDTTPPAPPVINSTPPNPSNETSPSFGFNGEAGATFQCELDTGGFSSCTSPRSYSGLADGSHTFRVRATDAAGNTGAATTHTWVIDTAPPPAPSITSGPSDPTNATSATFAFSDTEPGVTLFCQLDAGAFTGCTSPKSYTGLADGSHTFRVKARDMAGNDSGSATRTWTVDTVSPTTTITSTPPNPSNNTGPAFSFSANETATFQCKLDAGVFAACTSPKGYSGLADGSHTFQVKATDQAQNTGPAASYTWSIDATPPAISLTSPANGASTAADRPTFLGTAGTAAGDSTTVTVKVWSGPVVSGSPVQTLTTTSGTGGAYSVTASSSLSPGTYTARAEQGDVAGNTGLSTANTFTVTDPVFIGAGDIADCGASGDEATAAILDSQPDALVFTVGDNVYPNGTPTEFANCYDPSWGRAKARTRPTLGDHDYADGADPNATGYFGYFQAQLAPFGAAALDPTRGWYSYDVGAWHVAVTNADCGTGDGSLICSQDAQEQWLRSDLASHPNLCNLAIVHEPRWSSGSVHGNTAFVQRYWQAAYDNGADIVLSGSDHIYERFAPQDGAGVLDTQYGVREFIVGTGGAQHYGIGTIKPNSEVRITDTFGVLKLTLHPASYDWQFIPEAGSSLTDAGSNACHATPPPPAPQTPQVRSVASNAGNSLASITINKPAGTVQGDLLAAVISHQSGNNRSMTAPAGWTAIPGTDVWEGSNTHVHGWYRVAGASEPASYTFTLTGGDGRDTAGGIIAISGANQTTPINASAGQSNGGNASTSVPAPSITTTVPNALLIYAGTGASAATYIPPGNMAEQFDRATSGTYRVSIETATQALANSGATGTRTALASTSVRSIGLMFAVRPQ